MPNGWQTLKLNNKINLNIDNISIVKLLFEFVVSKKKKNEFNKTNKFEMIK